MKQFGSYKINIRKMMQITEIKPEDKNIPEKIGSLQIRKISWKDFKGKVNSDLPYSAHIYWSIDYEIFTDQKKKKSFVKVDVKILPRSWSLQQNRNPHLLMHEYGHYLIGCICALTFQRKINYSLRQPLTYNINEWIRGVFRETLDEYLKYQKLYDEQTEHRLNYQKQEEWQNALIKILTQFSQQTDKLKCKQFKIHKYPKAKNSRKSNISSR